jgi:membrane-bound serine protease (ClpP class)
MNPGRALCFAALVLTAAALASACSGATPPNAVHVLKVDRAIDPVVARYIDRGISKAENNSARLVVIELDTPGGDDTSMRDIVKRIEAAKVPVAVYVYPPGGRAASAGTFITMAANYAVMAPNTSIGAASPINANGSDIGGTLGQKITNDTVSFARGIAELRGRNADWAEQAVRSAVSVNQTDAVNLNVVDFVAENLQVLLAVLDGRQVTGQPAITGLVTAPIVHTNLTAWEKFTDFFADPALASLLVTFGFIALVVEMVRPGLILPGVAGAVAIALGFLGFGLLPVDTVGLVLIGLGLVFIAFELFVPSGFLGAGGAIAIILGTIISFRDAPAASRPPVWLLILLGGFLLLVFTAMAANVRRLRGMLAKTGTDALIGKLATARTPLEPEGYVFVQGERWKAVLEGGTAREGDRVRIVGAHGFSLEVRKEEES